MERLKVKNLSFGKDHGWSLLEYIIKTVSKSSFMLPFSEASNKLPAWWSADLIICMKFLLVCSAQCVMGHLQPGGKVFHPVSERGREPQPRGLQASWGSQRWEAFWWLTETGALAGCRCVRLNLDPQTDPAHLSEWISSEWSRAMCLGFTYEILNLPEKALRESHTRFVLASWYPHHASGL